eukprot:TRINITY_DN1535_c1_g1_i1.p1 TRINITY_DN1535_c1_g1~~TRINITY_DN1535_c1_g1_i1.p1  ORF type:complete len:305 (+),score=54.10 TRINITY_DN1535_c1_g1_i1:98-1012(+)
MFAQDEYGLRNYGGLDQPNKGLLLPGQRRRMNLVPIILCILIPWLVFVAVFALMSFGFHYRLPLLTNICFILILFGVLCVCAKAYFDKKRGDSDPTWVVFLAVSLVVAIFVGYDMGEANYATNTKAYYDLNSLSNYTNVFPNRMLGQQLMDAGVVTFAKGSQLDISRSMGFKNSVMYCVAPIVFGKEPSVSYDFWAVGKDCCSGSQADFHCDHYNDPAADGGLRLLDSGDKAFYRLAVQQAEATYNIKAATPVFFTWDANTGKKMNAKLSHAKQNFVAWMMSYLVFQIFVVIVAAVVFSKIGRY